ncbi:hypothetical protein [Streptomyces sp. VNUA24]|uniref:hypothetical protein n=1 Tax=Streptomyces sp. VNUA24 TaxID=3031131 RepID=UPI0023B7A717|nr:hypothetical protein [Streptomyces sp. VNUA24]WEH13454.1 hypothetical protein PYR72_06950 [Streptomyces sp. VNUA24]
MPRKGARGGAGRDVETALDELYATPPPSFVARREELTAEARADGRVEEARRIRAARRPSLAAWTANLLLRSEPEESRRFLELGRALREAYRSLDADGVKELSEQRRSIVAALSRQAAGLADEAGHRLSEPVRREVEDTLRAVLADEEAAGRWATGRLESALTPPTDLPGGTAGGAPSAAPGAPSRSTAAPSAASRARAKDEAAERRRQKQKREEEREQEQLARAREAARAADRRVRDLRAARADAQAVRERARDRYEAAENDVSEAERLLRRAREELRGADRERQRAEKECAAAAEAVSGAEQTAREAAREVSRLSGRSAD